MSAKMIKGLEKYEDQWVALSQSGEEIVGSGRDVLEAKTDARARGYKGEITFMKVPRFDQFYIPTPWFKE